MALEAVGAADTLQAAAGREQSGRTGSQACLPTAHTCQRCWEVQRMSSTGQPQTDPAAAQICIGRAVAKRRSYKHSAADKVAKQTSVI